MNEPLDELLARLCDGDVAAAERVFVEYEPYLRKAIRRQLPSQFRPKFDSDDILQSVWVDLLAGFRDSGWRFADADQLRGFLFVATRNRLIDRVRRHRTATALEEPLHGNAERRSLESAKPRPSEVAEADDLWERLLARCPPEHRPILGLRREGFSLAEIAARTGLHPDSVRRVLRTLARQMAFGPAKTKGATGDASS
jgi:RNA polymerase sigma-70 factor (ECF subfamily)